MNSELETSKTTKKLIGYARVSADDQNLERQRKALLEYGVRQEDLYCEKISSKQLERKELEYAINILCPGDTFVVLDLDRMSRTTLEGLRLIAKIHQKGCSFKSLNDGEFSLSNSPEDEFKATMLLAIANYEYRKMKRRIEEGRKIAKQNNKLGGRPSNFNFKTKEFEKRTKFQEKLNLEERAHGIIAMYNSGLPLRQISRNIGLTMNTIYRVLRLKGIRLRSNK